MLGNQGVSFSVINVAFTGVIDTDACSATPVGLCSGQQDTEHVVRNLVVLCQPIK